MTRPWLVVALCACRFNFEPLTDGGGVGVIDADDRAGDGSDAADRPNRVFITSTIHAADFGGIAAADAICQARADAANLDGTFLALLGTAARPEPRLAGSRGWIDTVGTPIVDEPATWLDGTMFHPLRRDENGNDLGYVLAWIGSIYDCSGWTSTALADGSVVSSMDVFGAYTIQGCAQNAHFVCAETGHVAPVSPTTVTGRLAFLTSTTWTPNGGVAAADAFCASDALAHGIAGSYRALLADSTITDPFSRFSLSGPTWTRLDGIAIAPTAATLASSSTVYLESFPHVKADRSHYPYASMWTGTSGSHCLDWTTADAGEMGTVGVAVTSRREWWWGLFDSACDVPYHLLCLQE